MAKKFFVWADANCNGENIEWIELTGAEYYQFRINPANAGRHIIKLLDHITYEADAIYIEATEQQYREWREEYLHSLYIRKGQEDITTVSLDEICETPCFEIAAGTDIEAEIIGDSSYDILFHIAELLLDKERVIFDIFAKSKMMNVPVSDVIKDYDISERTYYRKIPTILKNFKKLAESEGLFSALT